MVLLASPIDAASQTFEHGWAAAKEARRPVDDCWRGRRHPGGSLDALAGANIEAARFVGSLPEPPATLAPMVTSGRAHSSPAVMHQYRQLTVG